jgi:hypothetical protein
LASLADLYNSGVERFKVSLLHRSNCTSCRRRKPRLCRSNGFYLISVLKDHADYFRAGPLASFFGVKKNFWFGLTGSIFQPSIKEHFWIGLPDSDSFWCRRIRRIRRITFALNRSLYVLLAPGKAAYTLATKLRQFGCKQPDCPCKQSGNQVAHRLLQPLSNQIARKIATV